MTADTPKSSREAFNERTEFTLDRLDYRLRRDPLTIMPVLALARDADGLTKHEDRVRAVELLTPYIFENTTVGPAVFRGWDLLVRKIAEQDLVAGYRLASDSYNKLQGGEQIHRGVAKLFSDISGIWETNRQRALLRYEND